MIGLDQAFDQQCQGFGASGNSTGSVLPKPFWGDLGGTPGRGTSHSNPVGVRFFHLSFPDISGISGLGVTQ